jgi:CheY-like chemotaxis protein
MAEATQPPEPIDEPSGRLADSLLESPNRTCPSCSEAASAETAEGLSQIFTETNRKEPVKDPITEAAEPSVANRQPQGVPLSPAFAAEPVTEIEIEWEVEVEAFVKTGGAASTAAGELEMSEDNGAVSEDESTSGVMAADTPEEESNDMAATSEDACQCFAGTMGTVEPSTAEEISAAPAQVSEKPLETLAADQAGICEAERAEIPTGHVAAATAETSEVAQAKPSPQSSLAPAMHSQSPNPQEDRRRRRRAMISAPVRVRGVHVTNAGPDEVSTTIDVSRNGILFTAIATGYYKGMEVAVIFPYSTAPTAIHSEQQGSVVRISQLPDGRTAVAIALGTGPSEDLVDTSGRKLTGGLIKGTAGAMEPGAKKPLILAMDPDVAMRIALKTFLELEGYEVIAVGSLADARHVLEMCDPALVIAEVEGESLPEEGLPGYDLCAHIKETRRLKRIPVVLTTRSAYPSDYSNAHSLGAIVCMAKPYKQERLGHVARLLAPLQAHKEAPIVATVKPDPKRKACATPHHGAGRAPVVRKKYDENTNPRRKYRFPSFR